MNPVYIPLLQSCTLTFAHKHVSEEPVQSQRPNDPLGVHTTPFLATTSSFALNKSEAPYAYQLYHNHYKLLHNHNQRASPRLPLPPPPPQCPCCPTVELLVLILQLVPAPRGGKALAQAWQRTVQWRLLPILHREVCGAAEPEQCQLQQHHQRRSQHRSYCCCCCYLYPSIFASFPMAAPLSDLQQVNSATAASVGRLQGGTEEIQVGSTLLVSQQNLR